MLSSVLKTYFFFGLRVLIPLMVLPLLSHKLGAENFGIAMTSQSLGLLGSVLVQYGFHSSASRELGISGSAAETNGIIGGVLMAQILTSVATAVIISIASLSTPALPATFLVVASTVMIALGTGLSPAWYFRGTGRPATGIALELFGQIITFVGIMVLVASPEELVLVLVLMGIGPAISAIIGTGWVVVERRTIVLPGIKDAFSRLRAGFPLFLVRASSTGFTIGSTWLVSLLTTPQQVAYYGVAAKIVAALTTFSQPVLFALLPDIARKATQSHTLALKTAMKWGAALVLLGCCATIGVQIFADLFIATLFADDIEPAAMVTRVMAFVCIVAALRDTLGELVLVPLHHDKIVAFCVMAGGISGVVLAIFVVPHFGAMGMAYAKIASELATMLLMLLFLVPILARLRRKEPASPAQ